MSKQRPTLSKPMPRISADAALAFAEAKTPAHAPIAKPVVPTARLNANIPVELHRALKMKAVTEGKTIGALVEDWIRSWANK